MAALAPLPPGLVHIPAQAIADSNNVAAGTRVISRIRFEVTPAIRHNPPDPTQHPLLHHEVVKYRINDLVGVLLEDKGAQIQKAVAQTRKQPKKFQIGSISAGKREIAQKKQNLTAEKEVERKRATYERNIAGHLREIRGPRFRDIAQIASTKEYNDATIFALQSIQDSFTELSIEAGKQGVALPQIRITVPVCPDLIMLLKFNNCRKHEIWHSFELKNQKSAMIK